MNLTWDEAKRQKTLTERGLDFSTAAEVFAGVTRTVEDTREDYGEQRFITIGFYRGRMVVIVYTPRGDTIHIISMRKANEREQKHYTQSLDRRR